MAKKISKAAIEQLENQAQELRDVIAECDAAIAAAQAGTTTVLIEDNNNDDANYGNAEDFEYFVPKEYILEAFHKWREDICLRLLAVTQKLEGLV